MNYKKTVEYLYRLLPEYQNIGKPAFKKDLTNTIILCESLGNPQNEYKTIHIGGTNGKGTVSHIMASICRESGHKTGLYTSPHYVDFRERIKVDGQLVSEDWVVQFVKNNRALIEKVRPSFFEFTVAMAFTYFSEQKVDVAVIEVGLGGRLDSTNVILPEVAIITNIGMDHMDLLGDTIEKIAFEKAGIIKPNVPVVIGEFDATSSIVFQTIAEERKAPITWASEKWKSSALNPHSNKIKISDEKRELTYAFDIEVPNPFLTKNIITALEAAEVLQTSKAIRAISSQSIKTGVENFRSNSNYVGRWQPLGNSPYIIADSGHNSHALIHTMEYLSALKYRKFHMVIGFVKGKDMEEILNLLPTEFEYYFCKPNLKRGMETSEYFQRAKKLGIKAESYISVQSAYQAALRCVEPNDLIFVGGSSFVVGEVLEFVASTI